jgi:transposase-like protein
VPTIGPNNFEDSEIFQAMNDRMEEMLQHAADMERSPEKMEEEEANFQPPRRYPGRWLKKLSND